MLVTFFWEVKGRCAPIMCVQMRDMPTLSVSPIASDARCTVIACISLCLPSEVEQMTDSVMSIRNRTQGIKWPYFHTLNIFHSNGHIYTH
jgi:hypothetical protein